MKREKSQFSNEKIATQLLGGFQKFAQTVVRTSGHPLAFTIAIGIIVIWGLSGPFFSLWEYLAAGYRYNRKPHHISDDLLDS